MKQSMLRIHGHKRWDDDMQISLQLLAGPFDDRAS